MEFLKKLFGDKALTYAELEAALKDNKEIKLGNLASGQYVDKAKLEGKITELDTANQTIKDLQDTVKKFDGVDLEKLKKDVSDWEQKYNTDTAKLKLNYALETALMAGKAKNTKAVINGVEWQSRKAATQRKTGQVAADNVRIIIPFRARTKSVYIKPKAWEQLGALSGYWTLSSGDTIVKGEVKTEIIKSSKELQIHDDVMIITAVDTIDTGNSMSHFDVMGK